MKIVVALILIGACSLIAFARTDSRSELLKSCRSQTGGTRGSRKQLLAPSAEDQAACAEFLAQPETGLIRILPREKFEWSSNNKSGLTLRGRGPYYSFSRQTHEYGSGSDIELQGGYLSVGFGRELWNASEARRCAFGGCFNRITRREISGEVQCGGQ